MPTPNMNGRTNTNTAPQGRSQGKMAFKPVASFDVNDNPPDALPGSYFIRFETKKRASAKQDPQIVLEHKIIGVADGNEENERFIGAAPSKFLTFSNDARTARMTKTELTKIAEKIQLDDQVLSDLAEKGISSEEDLQPLCDALEAVEQLQVWITNDPDRRDPNVIRCNIHYDEPMTATDLGAPVNEEEEEAPPARASAKKTAANKGAAKRR